VLHKLIVFSLATVVLAASASAAADAAARRSAQQLFPGVIYERQVQFTRRGPVVLHVITAPRPTGAYSLEPVLSNGVVSGREPLTAIQRRLAAAAAVAGVNGDFFYADGRPSGIVMQDGVLHSFPYPGRSSLGIDANGNLRVATVAVVPTWNGRGQRRPLGGLNRPPSANGVTLFTPAWGRATPVMPGSVEAVVGAFPPTAPNVELAGTITALRQGGGTPIPAGGAVLVARGNGARFLAAEAPVGTQLGARIVLPADWGAVDAIGGGPVLVRGGRAVFRAREAFPPLFLATRQARTAVAQRADGRIALVAVDGGRLGVSTGLSNFELAQALVRLGAVTGYALAGGSSTVMAGNGRLLSRPRRGEPALADALMLLYRSARVAHA
jgi:hypothetical protein